MSDICNDLVADYEREPRPDGADAYRDSDVRIRAAKEIRSLRREIARLRLTDAEREAVEVIVSGCSEAQEYSVASNAARIVRGLLERTK